MQLKDTIKNKICLIKMTPNYPLGDFVKWAEETNVEIPLLSVLLDEIQAELDCAERASRQSFTISQHHIIKSYWCLYCSQVRAYYKAIVRHPDFFWASFSIHFHSWFVIKDTVLSTNV